MDARRDRARVGLTLVLAAVVLAIGWVVRLAQRPDRGETDLEAAPTPWSDSADRARREVGPLDPRGAHLVPVDVAPALLDERGALPASDRLIVHVIDRESGRGVAAARVLALNTGDLELHELPLISLLGHDDEMVERRGGRYETDSWGRALLPPAGGSLLLFAREGRRRSAVVEIDAASGPVTLEIEPWSTFTVAVLSSAGAPVSGVPLAETRVGEGGPAYLRPRFTDADGRLRFEIPDRFRREPARAQKSVTVVAPLAESVSLPFPPAESGDSVETIRLSPTATVTIALRREDGTPFDEPVGLTLVDPDRPRVPAWSLVAEQGVARFPFIGPGRIVRIGGRPLDESHGPLTTTVAAPATAGEEVVREWVFGAFRTVVTGLLVDDTGQPLSRIRCDVRVREAGSKWSFADWSDELPVRTDAEGRFRHAVIGADRGEPFELELIARASVTSRWDQGGPLARVRVEAARARIKDLGVLIAARPPVAVAGRVVDAAGAPISDVHVEIAGADDVTDAAVIATGPDGVFELRGRESELELLFSHAEYVDVGRRFVTPQRDAVVELRRWGRALVRLLLDDPRLVFEVDVGFAAAGKRVPAFVQVGDEPGELVFTRMRPATGALVVTCGGTELARVDDVTIPAGEWCADPRLAGVDLRGRVPFARIHAVTADGEPIADAVLSGLRRAGRAFPSGPRRRGVDRLLVAIVEPVDAAQVWAPGYETLELGPVRASRTVILVPARPFAVSLRWAQEGVVYAQPFELVLRRCAPRSGRGRSLVTSLLPNQTTDVAMPEPGEWLLEGANGHRLRDPRSFEVARDQEYPLDVRLSDRDLRRVGR